MGYNEWLPTGWLGEKEDDDSPFAALRKQIDTLFDDFTTGSLAKSGMLAVRSNVSETDSEIRITAELPGIELKDIDVSVSGNRITIKGEKKSEKEEKGEEEGREFHRIERRSGSFLRSMTVPFNIDPETVRADAKDGVLTVTVGKPEEVASATKKIDVKKAD